MYVINDWYYTVGALDKNTCDRIKNLAAHKWKKAQIDGYVLDENIRKSDCVAINEQWLFDMLYPYMQEANEKAGWKYDIRAAEKMQITRYKKGQYYNFHKDGKGDHPSAYDKPDNKFLHGHVRKLSMTVLLNDNYEGGEFQFAFYKEEKCGINTPEFNKIGSIIVFPSEMEHRVTPVTKGIRYSLVSWFVGPPFK